MLLDIFIQNIIYVMFPVVIYLFYVAYKRVDDDKENSLALVVTIFSSLYLVIKYGRSEIGYLPIIMTNLPLLIAYQKGDKLSILLTSVIIVIYSYYFYGAYLFLLMFEYLALYVIYVFGKSKDIFSLVSYMLMIKVIFLFFKGVDLYGIMLILLFSLAAMLILYLLDKAGKLLTVHMSFKQASESKQTRNSLFQIAHEIKNPIAVCKGYLDMFDVDNLEHSKRYIPIIKEEVDKTLRLLEDFMSISKLKLDKDVVDVNVLLSDMIDSYKPYLKKHKIKIRSKLKDDEIYIDADYNRLNQVLTNVIKNSVEAEAKEIIISNCVKKGKAIISIKDDGNGIDKDVLKHLKEPFYTTKIKGNGLGVYLSDEIIKAHDGSLEYGSDGGTVVTITLPVLEMG